MRLLIDTNVILDMVFRRNNYSISEELFRKIAASDTSAWITASTVTDLFYIIRKETHDTDKTYQIMENILKLANILTVTSGDIHEAFEKRWKDFEDCVQYTVAQNNKIDYLITVNQRDFEDHSLGVVSPEECLKFFV